MAPAAPTNCRTTFVSAVFSAAEAYYRTAVDVPTLLFMANGVYHTGYDIVIHLTRPDLGHPDRPGLLEEITQPIGKRDRELLQCLQYYKTGICRAEDDDRSPWMAIRRRTIGGRTTLVAAHLPVRHQPTAEESARHQAMKERIARAADRHGLTAQTEARTPDGTVRSDVLVTGAAGRIGWEAQYSPITAGTVRRRSQAAVDHGIFPMWLTNSDRAALIDRAPWVQVDDVPWTVIASPQAMLVRAGVRHLQRWKCTRFSERSCPVGGVPCGRFHALWELPALCLPPKPPTHIDQLVVTTADGEHVPMRIPHQNGARGSSRMWVLAEDRDEWRSIFGPDEEDETHDSGSADGELTFTEEPLDARCRYGEETTVFDDPRPRRGTADARGLHTFDDVPPRLFKIPRQLPRLDITPAQRQAAAARYGCEIWNIGPCAGCAAPIHRYGPGSHHACLPCRARGRSSTPRAWSRCG